MRYLLLLFVGCASIPERPNTIEHVETESVTDRFNIRSNGVCYAVTERTITIVRKELEQKPCGERNEK